MLWRLLGGKRPVNVDLKSGAKLRLRSMSTTDYDTAWQIYWRGDYEAPHPLQDVRKVIDLGANVGYSCVYWCQQYPQCKVTAFEPHPLHLQAMTDNLARNGFLDRVRVVAAAAGSKERSSYLSDARSSSTVTEQKAAFQIRVLDLFRESETAGTVDLLKIDIEGGEYELLADPRFAEMDVRALVVEWHNTPDHPDGRAWCVQRLQDAGYRIHLGAEDPPLAGLVWAFR